MVLAFLQRQRRILDRRLTERGLAHTCSLPLFQLHRNLWGWIDAHAKGVCLDAGSGRSPLKRRLQDRGLRTISIDVEDRAGQVDRIADIQEMPVIGDGSIGTVICTQVLEHLPRPWAAAREISRVLEPGGALILSVPHLSLIHEAPNDFFRFTRYGLESLLAEAGLRVNEIRESGGLLSFLAHGASALLLCTFGAVPGLRRLTWAANYLVLVRMLDPVDRLIGFRSRYPCNYVVLAFKEGTPGG